MLTTEDRIRQLETRASETERELRGIRAQLEEMTRGRFWRSLQWSRRVRYWLFHAPAEARRERIRALAQRMSPGNVCRRAAARFRSWKRRWRHRLAVRTAWKSFKTDSLPSGYDVICLPVMPWRSRVQRPQQLMRQFARRGHRVFYASLGFQEAAAADLALVERGIYETTLPGTPGTNVYQQLPTDADVEKMAAAVERLRTDCRIASAVIVIQLPFWTSLAETLRERLGWPIVYDCMDDHSGFSTNCDSMLHMEDRTIAEADLVVVTSELLRDKVAPRARRTALIRNACDYAHFAGEPRSRPESARAEPVTIGFYGAVAEWFDADLVADLAELRPTWKFELIGSTHTGDITRLAKLPNVRLLGERPYADLPRLVAHWHCHIIPFKRIPLTEATNPVKAYEMLATGKPVVAVDLPELRSMAHQGLLTLADNAAEFAAALETALNDSPIQRDRRRAFAAENTWESRWNDLDAAIRRLFPLASIIVVTYNNLAINKVCLHSIVQQTDYPNYEVLVVDNASSDNTPAWLREWAGKDSRFKVILNGNNRGYAAANNQALRQAHGEFLCLLNNDTVVTRGWLATLLGHLRAMPGLGLVGPVSNSVGNEAQIPVGYKNIAAMPSWAEKYCRDHDGETVPLDMLGFFCVVMPREVYERVGELDERFGLGYFEDDDYCRRVRERGYGLRFARDAFVHHWKEASFGLLGEERYLRLYHENRCKFEAKWNGEEEEQNAAPKRNIA